MIDHRPFKTLGAFQNDWLNARYHFSFSGYHDPARVQWGALRVWNDDEIKAGTGFAPHGHSDMEIITYVREGAITHRDSLGNQGRTVAGDVQVMSAGSGITHSEVNAEAEMTQLYQIWILPKVRGGKPFWGHKAFPKQDRGGGLVTLASGFEADITAGAAPIRQDARLLAATVRKGETVDLSLATGRNGYLAMPRGAGALNGIALAKRDGVAFRDEEAVRFTATEDAEVLLVDAP
jgi:quercetin 2,3-dioxygenase